jgi:hypothetical protein
MNFLNAKYQIQRRVYIGYDFRAEDISRLACGKLLPMPRRWLGLITFWRHYCRRAKSEFPPAAADFY